MKCIDCVEIKCIYCNNKNILNEKNAYITNVLFSFFCKKCKSDNSYWLVDYKSGNEHSYISKKEIKRNEKAYKKIFFFLDNTKIIEKKRIRSLKKEIKNIKSSI